MEENRVEREQTARGAVDGGHLALGAESFLVRVHGLHAVQDVLSEMAAEVHRLDPRMLVTYSNYPTTEFLEIDGLDVCSFNVFLEDEPSWGRYVRHLMTVAGDRPLLLTEL